MIILHAWSHILTRGFGHVVGRLFWSRGWVGVKELVVGMVHWHIGVAVGCCLGTTMRLDDVVVQ